MDPVTWGAPVALWSASASRPCHRLNRDRRRREHGYATFPKPRGSNGSPARSIVNLEASSNHTSGGDFRQQPPLPVQALAPVKAGEHFRLVADEPVARS